MSVHEVSPEEGRELFDRWCREWLGVSAEDFFIHYDRGEAELLGPAGIVDELVMLMPFGRQVLA